MFSNLLLKVGVVTHIPLHILQLLGSVCVNSQKGERYKYLVENTTFYAVLRLPIKNGTFLDCSVSNLYAFRYL